MAATRLITMHVNKGKTVARCLKDRTDYAKNGEKTENGEYISAYACDAETADEEFMLAKQEYFRITGRKPKGDIIAYQIRQSFKPGEITPEEANQVGYETAMRFTKGNHAFIVATHTDRAHIHNHIIFNSTNLSCDRKFRDFFFIGIALQHLSDLVCIEHGLSIIKPRKPSEREKRTTYPERKSFRDELRETVDQILQEEKPDDFDAFLAALQKKGYEIKRGKNTAIRGKSQKRFIRFRSLGVGYTEEDLRKIFAGEWEQDPEKMQGQQEPNKRTRRTWQRPDTEFDLLIDIQKKIAEGKGRGFETWATNHNTKQIAKAIYFLEQHGVRDYSEIEAKLKEKTARFGELSSTIKEKEKRLAEISVLKTHIINYSKTKEVYVSYRKSGYNKKFFEAHREEILLHKAAKQAFTELQTDKLPKVKELSAEYTQVLAEKKAAYTEYRQVKKEMQEYGIAKQDIDRFLKIDEEAQQQEKENKKETAR